MSRHSGRTVSPESRGLPATEAGGTDGEQQGGVAGGLEGTGEQALGIITGALAEI